MPNKLAGVLKSIAWSIADLLKSIAWSILNLLIKISGWLIKLALCLLAFIAGAAFFIALLVHIDKFVGHTPDDLKTPFANWFVMVGEAVLVIAVTIFINYDGDYLADRRLRLYRQAQEEKANAARAEREDYYKKLGERNRAEEEERIRANQSQRLEPIRPPESTPLNQPPPATVVPSESQNASQLDHIINQASQNPPSHRITKREQRDILRDAHHHTEHPPAPTEQTAKLNNEL